jgi:O-antigen/teichoic acid export membrane protein
MTARGGSGAPQPLRALVASTVATAGTTALVAFLSLINVLIVARTLGPTGRGDVAFLTTVAVIGAALVELGVRQANVNLASTSPQLRPVLAGNSLLLAALLGGAIAAPLLAVLMEVFPGAAAGSDRSLRLVALGSVPVLVLQSYLRSLLEAQYRFAFANGSVLAGPATNVIVNGILAGTGALTVGTAIVTWVVGWALTAVLPLWYILRRLGGIAAPDLALARRTLGFGLRTHLGRVLTLGNLRLDQWFVAGLAGSRELGLYSVAVAWAETLFYVPAALATVQRPDLARSRRADAARHAAGGVRSALGVTLVLTIGIVVAAPVLCVGVYGDDFRGSVDDLRALAPGALAVVVVRLLGNALTAQGRPLLESISAAAGLGTMVALDLWLIPAHGGFGAAVASTVSYSVAAVVIATVFARALGGRVRDLLPRGDEVAWLRGRLAARRRARRA